MGSTGEGEGPERGGPGDRTACFQVVRVSLPGTWTKGIILKARALTQLLAFVATALLK